MQWSYLVLMHLVCFVLKPQHSPTPSQQQMLFVGVLVFDSAEACATYSTYIICIKMLFVFLTYVQLNQLAIVVHMYD